MRASEDGGFVAGRGGFEEREPASPLPCFTLQLYCTLTVRVTECESAPLVAVTVTV